LATLNIFLFTLSTARKEKIKKNKRTRAFHAVIFFLFILNINKKRNRMARRSSGLLTTITVANLANKWQNLRSLNENISASSDEQKGQMNAERFRILSAKVERCIQELIERTAKRNSSLNFELLAPPSTHVSPYVFSDYKEAYFDFYLVWQNIGKVEIERDQSSICRKIKYLDRLNRWSRAEQQRLLISNLTRKCSYLNGRGLRDLFFETLREISPDLSRLDFLEHFIFFDLIIPSLSDKITCHITLLPCLHLSNEQEVLLPFGTLRWYPRSLLLTNEKMLSNFLQIPLQNLSIRRFLSSLGESVDESEKLTKKDQQDFAYVRVIIHELLLPSTLEHIDSIEQIQQIFDDENENRTFFLPHKFDRNCNVFPAGQYLLNDHRARSYFREFLKINSPTVVVEELPTNDATY